MLISVKLRTKCVIRLGSVHEKFGVSCAKVDSKSKFPAPLGGKNG